MDRETRYMVLKLSDINKYLFPDEIENLIKMSNTIVEERADDGKPPLKCVVVEDDWPMYEATWKSIEKFADG